jgi:glycosyltransferase involved in cell wall biosynthesis
MGVHVNFKKFTICYLGQLTQTVDFDDVIAGMAMLKRRNQNVQLIVCGTGDKEVEFRRKADGLENIIFTGWVGSDVGAFIMKSAKASLICYHSTPDYEMSIPNKIPEYLSYGLPILCSIDGYPREIIEKNNCGIYYKSGSVNSFVESVNALCMNPYSRSTMSQNAVKTFSDNFSSEVVYGAMVKHLEGVVRQFRGC